MNAKRWNQIVIGGTIGILFLIATVNIIIDPFLHYHAPLKGLEYPLQDERYTNDGIARNTEYDAVITGTSMTQNFKPSEFDALFGCTTVKLSFSGGSYKEINDNVLRALTYNPDIKYVVRSLDSYFLNYPANATQYTDYPEYLYDSNPFNDVNYILNKEVLPKTIAVINYTRAGHKTPSWDSYSNWSRYKTYGRDSILRSLSPQTVVVEEEIVLQDNDYLTIQENIKQNILDTAIQYPETEFYLFFPPYSIYHWESLVRTKQLNAQLDAEQYAVELLLEAENIHIFAFGTNIELSANPDNYTDFIHYGEWVNSDILKWMSEGEGELTKDNYLDYFSEIRQLYTNYDYSRLFE